jgi:hypothetical protein
MRMSRNGRKDGCHGEFVVPPAGARLPAPPRQLRGGLLAAACRGFASLKTASQAHCGEEQAAPWSEDMRGSGLPRVASEYQRRPQWMIGGSRIAADPEFGDPFTRAVMLVGDQGKHA